MTDDVITTCHVVNKHDGLFITILTEWLDSGLKITIFSENSIPLEGQMDTNEVDLFAKNLNKSRLEYLDLTRKILSGKDDNFEFILKDDNLRWKKGQWNHGIIKMSECKMDEMVFPKVAKKLSLRYQELEKTANEIKTENEELRITYMGLSEKLDRMIEAKNELEENLYKRFIVVLNSKKEKIRELQRELNKRNGMDRSKNSKEGKIYEAETDQSEAEEEKEEESGGKDNNDKSKKEEKRSDPPMFLSGVFNNVDLFEGEKLLKRQMSDSEGKMIDSDFEEDERARRNEKQAKGSGRKSQQNKNKRSKRGEITPPRASTSKNILRIERIKPNCKSQLNFDGRESEEDIFSDDF